MADEKHEVWQHLVDQAYDSLKGKDIRYAQFIETLPGIQRQAVLFANLNHQVLQNGLSGWVDNGYAAWADSVSILFRAINSDLSNEVARRIDEFAEEFLDISKKEKDAEILLVPNNASEEEWEHYFQATEAFFDWYCDNSDEIEDEIEAYLTANEFATT